MVSVSPLTINSGSQSSNSGPSVAEFSPLVCLTMFDSTSYARICPHHNLYSPVP